MIRKTIIIGIFSISLIAFSTHLHAQSDSSSNDQENRSKWYFGGSIMANFGRSIDVFEFSPSLGYFLFQRKVLAGVSAYYTYYSYENIMDNYEYESRTHYLGAGVFTRYYLRHDRLRFLNYIYFQGEYELLRVIDDYNDSEDYDFKNKQNYQNVLAGIGYQQHLGGRFSLSFTLLASLLPKEKSPYTNPVFRMGFEF